LMPFARKTPSKPCSRSKKDISMPVSKSVMKSFLLSSPNLPLVWTLTEEAFEARLQYIQLVLEFNRLFLDLLDLVVDFGEVVGNNEESLFDLLLIHRFQLTTENGVVKRGVSQMTTFYLFLFRCEHKLFENGHIVLNKHSKILEGNIGTFIASKNRELEISGYYD
jgi:hypothetical protein